MKDFVENHNEAEERQDALDRIAAGVTPLEPRILLDAVLNLDGGLDDSSDLLFAVAGALDAQSDELKRVFDGVEDAFAQHIAGTQDTYDAGGPDAAADALFSGVREALDASFAAFEARIKDFVSGEADALLTHLNSALQTEFGNGVGQLANASSIEVIGIQIPIPSGAEALLTLDNLSDRDVFADTAAGLVGGTLSASDQAQIGDFIADTFVAYAGSEGFDLFTISLTDTVVNGADVTYADDGAGGVNVSAGAGDLEINPDSYFSVFTADDPNETFPIPVTGFDFDYNLNVADAGETYSLTAGSFDLDTFTIGGAIIDFPTNFAPGYEGGPSGLVPNSDLPVILGDLALAEIRFTSSGFDVLETTSDYNFEFDLARASTADTDLGFTTEIRQAEFDGGAGLSEVFVPLTTGTDFKLADANARALFTNFGFNFTTTAQPVAPVAFSAGSGGNGGGGGGFDGAGNGNAQDNINDASLILDGLDFILAEVDAAIDAVLEATKLPLIGDNLALGFSLFDDIRFDILGEAEARSTGNNSNGQPVTTIDLLTGFINDELNALIGTTGQTYLNAELGGFTTPADNFLHGNLGFKVEIFSAEIAAGFDLGVDLPGFDFDISNGSPLLLTTEANINIGFGVDQFGFFLLNDTNDAEVSLDFVVDAGDFSGTFTAGGLLDFTVEAVKDPTQLALFEFADKPEEGERGDVKLVASLEADLFDELGSAEIRRFDNFGITNAEGDLLKAEKSVRLNEINTASSFGQSIAEIQLTATADINLQLTGEVLDPTTGEPVLVNGVAAIPKVMTELVLDASLTSGQSGAQIDLFLLNDLRLDASPIYEGFIAPVVEPLLPFVGPIQALDGFLRTPPISFILPAAAAAFPVIGLAQDIQQFITKAATLVEGLDATDGFVLFGDQFIVEGGGLTDNGTLNASNLDENQKGQTPEQFLASQGLVLAPANSLEIRLPILEDVNNALNLIKGNFDEVSFVEAIFTGVNIDVDSKSILSEVRDIIGDIGVPDEIIDFVLDQAFPISASIDAFFGFTAGYDLSGLQGFIDTLDPDRLFEGIFIDVDNANGSPTVVEIRDPFTGLLLRTFTETTGGILDLDLDIDADLDFGGTFLGTGIEVGIDVSASSDSEITLADPNGDGKLRLNEIAALLSEINPSDFSSYLKQFFDGEFSFDLSFEIFGEVSVVGLGGGFSIDFFEFDKSISLGGDGTIAPKFVTDLGNGDAILNIGSRLAENFFSPSTVESANGREVVRFVFDSPENVFSYVGENLPVDFVVAELGAGFDSLVIAAGRGENVIDLEALTNLDTLTFSDGDVADNIDLAKSGFHVVFAGDNGSFIGAESPFDDNPVTGTYWIFGGEGADQVTIKGGTTVVFGAEDFGLRDAFAAEFIDGGFSQEAAEALLISHLASRGFGDGTGTGQAGVDAALAALAATYTTDTQITNSKTADTYDLGLGLGEGGNGQGSHTVFAAGGDDRIVIRGGETALALGGAGDDQISIDVDVSSVAEGGAGSDFMNGGDGLNSADLFYGYSNQLGSDGLTTDKALNSLANQDGNDAMSGGGGNDSLFGQRGDNYIEGGGGDDSIVGGRGDDIVFGGKLNSTLGDGTFVEFTDLSVAALQGKVFSALVFDDGNDFVAGGQGDDVVIGGAGADRVQDSGGANLLIGDFAEIDFTTAGKISYVISTEVENPLVGRDTITGGTGVDVIIGGGGGDGSLTFGGDFLSDSSGGNVVIGDDAEVIASAGGSILGDVEIIRTIAGAGADAGDHFFTGTGGGFDILVGGEGGDRLAGRLGGNIALGDLGVIDLAAGTITSAETDVGGDDLILLGSSFSAERGDFLAPNLVVAGAGDDIISGGIGADYVIADSGVITFDTDSFEDIKNFNAIADRDTASTSDIEAEDAVIAGFGDLILNMTSTGLASDGADRISANGGGDYIIAGGGADNGAGQFNGISDGGIFLLDSGTIDRVANIVTGVADEFAGDDVWQVGSGDHVIIGGGGDDLIELGFTEFVTLINVPGGPDERVVSVPDQTFLNGNGDNSILGDNGTVTLHPTLDTVISLSSLSGAGDGNDTVRAQVNELETSPIAGQGSNNVILGGGADEVSLGNGVNHVVADGGQIDFVAGTLRTEVTVPEGADDPLNFAGDDIITLGTGNNRVIAGGGADLVTLDNLAAVDAAGSHRVLTDSGVINFNVGDRIVFSITSSDTEADGNDTVTSGDGDLRVILGGGDDEATFGDGSNTIIADSGKINIGTGLFESFADDPAGADTLILGDGNNRVVLGNGADSLTLGEGFNRVIGDNGSINVGTGLHTGLALPGGGNDTITAGTGGNIVIGGARSDDITLGIVEGRTALGAGENLVLGDSGFIQIDEAKVADGLRAAALELRSDQDGASDGGDEVRLGFQDQLVVLGAGADTLSAGGVSGSGDDIIVGDAGRIDLLREDSPGRGAVFGNSNLGNNDDLIQVFRGNDIVIGGNGNDTITARSTNAPSGSKVILGDSGAIGFDLETLGNLVLTSEATTNDGDDSIRTEDADVLIIMGGGNDILIAEDNDKVVVGDGGVINEAAGTASGTVTIVDGVVLGGSDTVEATGGINVLIGGVGGDSLNGGTGSNFVIGDTGTATLTGTTGVNLNVSMLTATTLESDGDDTVSGTSGVNIAILGGGADSLTAGDADNLVLGDGGTITIGTSELSSSASDFDGADTITAGDGDNLVIGGGGADDITLGDGASDVLADSGSITPATGGVSILSSSNNALDGGDSVTVGDGDNRIILGAGDDTLLAGNGGNLIIGDGGRIDSGKLTTSGRDNDVADQDFDDNITAGFGANLIIGGAGGDTIEAGIVTDGETAPATVGDNSIIAGLGEITFASQTVAALVLTSAATTRDGRDRVTTGGGDDLIIGGAGADALNGGEGDNIFLGDDGVISLTAGTATSVNDASARGDQIEAGDGNNIAIGGQSADRITLGDGVNAVLGDSGEVAFGAGKTVTTITSSDIGTGANDTLTAGNGSTRAILGDGADQATTGTGADILLGDSGSINLVTGVATGSSEASAGGDTLDAGDGANLMIGGAGADSLTAGSGGDLILGDSGQITFDPASGAGKTLTSTSTGLDGNDTVTAGAGDNRAVLGGGADTGTFGANSDIVLGDGGTIDLVAGTANSASDNLAGADTVDAGNGNNLLIGGSGADSLTAGAGNNLVLGDTGEITFAPVSGAGLTLTSGHDSLDGGDVFSAGEGNNRAVLGGGADEATVQGGDNIIVADGGSINLVTGLAETSSNALAGSDTLVVGNGNNILLGGSFADDVTVGDGDNLILTDTGSVDFDPTTFAGNVLNSTHDALDGNDVLISGDGGNRAILGGANDNATMGEGDNIVVADGGTINLVTGLAVTSSNALAGTDTVIVADGNNILLGGSFADDVTVGDGDNLILTDTGSVDFDPTTFAGNVLNTTHDALDGNDSLIAGDGDNRVVLGAADDDATFGEGDNIVVADGGSINLNIGLVSNASDTLAGEDTVSAAGGDNMIVGGSRADTLTVGDGDNLILGDTGQIDFDPATFAGNLLTSTHDALDGNDTLIAGDGDNRAIIGGADDTGTIGEGDNIVVADGGSINLVTGMATTATNALAGSDTLGAGSGNNILLAGSFADDVTVGDGDNLILTDTGSVDFDPATFAGNLLTSTHDALDGNDMLIAGDGDNRAILGGADDSGTIGEGDNIVVTDGGAINLVTGMATTATNALAGSDTLSAGSGNNILLAGSFADDVTVGDGDNLILADTGAVNFDPTSFAGNVLSSTHDALDGDDSLVAGDGDNRAVLGGADDSGTFGEGDNIVVADGGAINLVTGVATTATNALAGSDTLATGSGDNILLGGSFADVLTIGDGDNMVLTDTGSVNFNPATFVNNVMTSRFDARDGADVLTAGNGDNRAILGGASDTGTFGNGDNQIIADSGVADEDNGGDRTLTSTDHGTGTGDVIATGTGNDVILGVDGRDTITAADGDNVIIGDGARVELVNGVADNRLLTVTSRSAEIGGADDITTGAGNDIVIGGTGNDTIRSNDGDDIVAGDWISVSTPRENGGTGVLTSTDTTVRGADLLETGTGNDIAIGGGASDAIAVDAGFDVAVGDNARVEYVNITDVDALTLTQLADGGKDTLTASGAGDNILIGQSGNDSLVGGDDNDILIGDLAEVSFIKTGTLNLGESQVERMVNVDFIRTDLGFDDQLEGGAGRDFLLAGMGADTLFGGDGQDLLAGDTFSLRTTYETTPGGKLSLERTTFDSNFALEQGGIDFLDGGDGPDIVVGGLGLDSIAGNTADDFIAGDAVALLLNAPFTGPDFDNDRVFELITVNFAGSGSGDLVSSAQVGGALGFNLSNFGSAGAPDTGIDAINDLIQSNAVQGEALVELLSERAQTLFEAVSSSVTTAGALQQIADIVALDLPQEMLVEMLQEGLAADLMQSLDGNLSALDRYLIMRLIEEVVLPALEDADAEAAEAQTQTDAEPVAA